jgi:hypothetical protein
MQPAPPLGILMLDTNFARPLGDAGNPASWPFPVIIERVPRACAKSVVSVGDIDYQQFVQMSYSIGRKGAIAIISTCSFLARSPLIECSSVNLDVLLSTLFKFAELRHSLPAGKQLAILTINASSFDVTIRANCGIPDDAIVASPARTSHFCRAILDESEPLDVAVAAHEWIEVERATGVRVDDTLHLGMELHARSFDKLRTNENV